MTGALAVLLGSVAPSAQATIDTENSYPNVGAIMVWRVDDSGMPVELRGFASGTLIRDAKAHTEAKDERAGLFRDCEEFVALQFAFVLRDIVARTVAALFTAMLCLTLLTAAHPH